MKKTIIISLAVFCGLLAGCDDKIHDVSYYKEHHEEAQKYPTNARLAKSQMIIVKCQRSTL